MKSIQVTGLTGTVGAPYLKETFVHKNEALQEMVDALVKTLIGSYTGGDVIILYGCEITGTTTKAITEGAIYLDGEVYLVDAASGLEATGPDTWIFAVVTTYAAGDPVTYDDATSHNQHRIDKIAFQVGDSGSDGYVCDWDAAIVKKIYDIINGVWMDASSWLINSYTVASGRKIQYKLDIYGNLIVRGDIQSPGSGTATQCLLIPSGLRPANVQQRIAVGNDSSGNVYLTTIAVAGFVTLQQAAGGTAFIGINNEANLDIQYSLTE